MAHISPAHSENINFFGGGEVDIEGELASSAPYWLPARCESLALNRIGVPVHQLPVVPPSRR